MKLLAKLFFSLIFLIIIIVAVAYFSFNTTKPRNLGITYTPADLTSGRDKSQIKYDLISQAESSGSPWLPYGQRQVDTSFSSSEITAIMNSKPGIFYPYKNVQVKFNADGSAEISGQLIKSRIPIYASTFDCPKIAVDIVMRFLPENPVFYLKGKASLVENKVDVFQPLKFEIGRIPMPLNLILASYSFPQPAYALDLDGLISEISTVTNKRQIIIDFINSRLSNVPGFYAQKADFSDNQLNYQGTLPEGERIVQ